MPPGEEHWIEAGDPTFLGWSISVAYLLTALLALRAWWTCRAGGIGLVRLATWWLGVSLLMILLGLNKELDLMQKIVRVWGKAAVISEGWYANRAAVQHAFVASVAVMLAVAVVGTLLYLHRVMERIIPALIGVALVLAYALLRTAVFNGLREAVPASLSSAMWLLEPAGVLLVLWCAWRASRSSAALP
jgi:hypothetical protein